MKSRTKILTVALWLAAVAPVSAQTRITLGSKPKVGAVAPTEKAHPSTPDPTEARYLAEVRAAYASLHRDSFEVAKRHFDAALQTMPKSKGNVEIYYQLGRMAECENRYAGAEDYYSRALVLNPKFRKGLLRRGDARLLQNKYREAVDDYTAALALDGDRTEALYYRGYAYMKQGDYENARKDYLSLLALKPRDEKVQLSLAFMEQKTGKPDEALQRLTSLIEQTPNNGAYYAARAGVETEMQRYAQALTDWNSAIQYVPDNGGYRLERAKLLYRSGKKKDAELDFLKARDLGMTAAEIKAARSSAEAAPKVKMK